MSKSENVPESRDRGQVGYKRPPKDRQWKPGQSGNPGGVPKGKRISTWMAELGEMTESALRKIEKKLPINGKIALARIRAAMSSGSKHGNGATEIILERTEGRVPQALEGPDGEPLTIQIVNYAKDGGNAGRK